MMDNQSKDPLEGNLSGTMAVVQRLSKVQITVEAQRLSKVQIMAVVLLLSKDPTMAVVQRLSKVQIMAVVQHLSSASCSTHVDLHTLSNRMAHSHQRLFNHPGDPLLIPTVQHKCNSTEDQASTVETTDS